MAQDEPEAETELNPFLLADIEVLKEFFHETGGKDKWIQGVAEFGTRLQPPPPPPDHTPELEERLKQKQEPLPKKVGGAKGRARFVAVAGSIGLAEHAAAACLEQRVEQLLVTVAHGKGSGRVPALVDRVPRRAGVSEPLERRDISLAGGARAGVFVPRARVRAHPA